MRPRPPRVALVATLLLVALPALGEEKAPALSVPFLQGRPFAELLKKARAEKKGVMVDVYATWCGPCKLMDRTTFSDHTVGDWARKNVVAAKVDAEKGEGRRIAQRYMVGSFPTVLFLDASGNELDRILGVYPPGPFVATATATLAGTSPLQTAIQKLHKSWTPDEASQIATLLAQRQDVARLRPIVVRLVSEDASPETSYQLLTLLAALEDFGGRLSPETADLVATVLPRIGNDPRRGALAVFLGREQVRRGESAAAKATANAALAALGDSSPYAADLFAVVGAAERKAGRHDAAIAAFRKAVALVEAANVPPSARGEKQMDLAEALAGAGKADAAKTALAAALERWPNDPKAWTRAAHVSLGLKETPKAVEQARRAVALTQGEDAGAQAALGAALRASGDAAGSAAAWKRAQELEPDNPDYRRSTAGAAPKPAAKAS